MHTRELDRDFLIVEFKRRAPMWHPDLPVVVCWSQKAACTAVARWFFAVLGGSRRDDGAGDAVHQYRGVQIHRYRNQVFNARAGYLEGCVDALAAGRPAVKFVRDPAARAYSGYISTCSSAVLRHPSYWGAKIRSQFHAAQDESTVPRNQRAHSFVEFIEWLAHVDISDINGHVRQQYQNWEPQIAPEIMAIEQLSTNLENLEQRFGLPRTFDQPDLLQSGHHRKKADGPSGIELEKVLTAPVPLHALGTLTLPQVDSRRLAGTRLGKRIREVFAQDYEAYGIY